MSRKRLPLSPEQEAGFAMGRALLIFDTWSRAHSKPIDFERAMLIDFGVQHPRVIVKVLPGLEAAMRAHDAWEGDLRDLFAQRHFGSLRERFTTTISDLVARAVLEETNQSSSAIELQITAAGTHAAGKLLSSLAMSVRGLAQEMCESWNSRNVQKLLSEIRTAIPDESDRMAGLSRPFGGWLDEAAL